MLKTASNTQALIDRLNAVPAAVESAVSLVARTAASAELKAAAIHKLAQRARDRRLHPDRGAAMARLARPAGSPARPAVDADKIRQMAVQAALTALGRG